MPYKNIRREQHINNFVAEFIKENFPKVTDAIAPIEETYDIDDVLFSGSTRNGEIVGYKNEIKVIRYHNLFKDNEFNPFFSRGVKHKMSIESTPERYKSILELKYVTEPKNLKENNEDNSNLFEGKPIYFINATDSRNNPTNSKAYKMIKSQNAYLTFVAEDGLLFFSPLDLRRAFLGYAWYLVGYGNGEKKWELKWVIDLTKGKYFPTQVPNLNIY